MTNIKSYIFQFTSILFSFFNIKLFLDFLGELQYSTWLVVFSVAGLIYTLDLGIGSSIRNQLARLLAKNAGVKAQAKLIVTYYKLIGLLALGFGLIAFIVGLVAHEFGWLNNLSTHSIAILAILIFIDLTARAHHSVFAGLQKPHLTNFALAIIQIYIFLSLYFYLIPNRDLISDKITIISIIVFGGSILINAFMIFQLNQLAPIFAELSTAKSFSLRLRHSEIHLKRGLPFFLLQIEFAILGQIALYFIYSNFEADTVVEMAIADKVFAPFIIISTIVMYPFWSTYTLMMYKGESDRIIRLLRLQEYFSLICLPALLICILIYDNIIFIWLNRNTDTNIFAIFAILKVYCIFINSIYSYFMNGIGNLKPQIYSYSLGLIVAFPILHYGSMYKNLYVCLSVTPLIFLVSAIVQRHFVYNIILAKKFETPA